MHLIKFAYYPDYMELRSKHRIMGAPVGTANTKGWSPNQSSKISISIGFLPALDL